jgi:hypothetical protein
VLDAVAVTSGATPQAIARQLSPLRPTPSNEAIRDVLRLLHEDHYLAHEPPLWRFTYRLVMQAWIDLRDLAADPEMPT